AVEALVTNGGLSGRGASAMSGAGGGAVGIAGSVAIDIENSHTVASIDGVLDAADGDVKIAAASNTQTETNALPSKETGGVTGAKSVGIGVSLAVTIANHRTEATLYRDLDAGGAVSLSAHGASDSSASAVASAAGAPQDESGAAAPTDSTGHAGTGVSDQVEHERGFA